MKKLTALLLCVLLMFVCSVTVYAETVGIDTSVPNTHKITVTVSGNADVTLNGQPGEVFEVERLSEPVLAISAKDGETIVKVTLNGEDITDKLADGKYQLAPVYEDLTLDIVVETEAAVEPTSVPATEPASAPATEPASTPATEPTSATPDSGSSSGNGLPQTGQIIIPIFILLIIGGLFITFGVRLSKSKKSR